MGRRAAIEDTPENRSILASMTNAAAAEHFGVSTAAIARARRRLATPSALADRKPSGSRITLDLGPELLLRVDAARGSLSRSEWIRAACVERLEPYGQ